MFQRILVAWSRSSPAAKSLEVARSLAEAYGAELTICCVVEMTPAAHADRELLRFAHRHAFDLLVLGRGRVGEPFPLRVIEWASLPVLVVAEDVP